MCNAIDEVFIITYLKRVITPDVIESMSHSKKKPFQSDENFTSQSFSDTIFGVVFVIWSSFFVTCGSGARLGHPISLQVNGQCANFAPCFVLFHKVHFERKFPYFWMSGASL